MVLAIDDVQWLDPSSARVLAYVARRLGDARCSMLLGLRAWPCRSAGRRGGLRRCDARGSSWGAEPRCDRPHRPPAGRRDLSRRPDRPHPPSGRPGTRSTRCSSPGSGDDELPETLAAGLQPASRGGAAGSERRCSRPLAVRGPLPAERARRRRGARCRHRGRPRRRGRRRRPVRPSAARRSRVSADPAWAAAGAAMPRPRRPRCASRTAPGTSPSRPTGADRDHRASSWRRWRARERMRGAPEVAAELAAHARRIMPAELEDAVARIALDEAGYLLPRGGRRQARRRSSSRSLPARPAAPYVQLRSSSTRSRCTDAAEAVADPRGRGRRAARRCRSSRRRTLAQLAWQRGAWQGDVEAALPEAERAVAMAEATERPGRSRDGPHDPCTPAVVRPRSRRGASGFGKADGDPRAVPRPSPATTRRTRPSRTSASGAATTRRPTSSSRSTQQQAVDSGDDGIAHARSRSSEPSSSSGEGAGTRPSASSRRPSSMPRTTGGSPR